jgi:hypothetical protein
MSSPPISCSGAEAGSDGVGSKEPDSSKQGCGVGSVLMYWDFQNPT